MIQFEPQAWWVYLLGFVALAITVLSYRNHPLMSELSQSRKNVLLFIRIAAIFLLALILFKPVLVLETANQRSSTIAIAFDGSQSIDKQIFDRDVLKSFFEKANAEDDDLRKSIWTFSEEAQVAKDSLTFDGLSSNLQALFQKITGSYNTDPAFKGLVLLSDGQFNRGGNPLLSSEQLGYPVYTVSIGEAVSGMDALLTNVRFNKKVELGNRLEVNGVARIKGGNRKRARLALKTSDGKLLDQKVFSISADDQSFNFSFYPEAGMNIGRRKLQLELVVDGEDINPANNLAAIVFEVIEKEAIVSLVFDRIHPDLGALARCLIDYDAYQVEYVDVSKGEVPDELSELLIVVHPGKDAIRKVNSWIQNSKVSIWWLAGYAESAIGLSNLPVEIGFQKQEGNDDEVFAAIDPGFSAFQLSEESSDLLARDAPLSSPYGKWFFGSDVDIQMFQKIGTLVTQKPLMFSSEDRSGRQWAVTSGRGIWRWRMQEYRKTQATAAFDEWVSSWVRFLQSNQNNNRLSIEAPDEIALGDLWQAEVRLKDASGAWSQRAEVNFEVALEGEEEFTQKGSAKGDWKQLSFKANKPGVYDYTITATLGKESFSEKGSLNVNELSLEMLNTGADTATLAEISRLSGGKHYSLSPEVFENIKSELDLRPIVSVSKEVQDLINYKALFFILLFLLTLEWGLRRYFGLY